MDSNKCPKCKESSLYMERDVIEIYNVNDDGSTSDQYDDIEFTDNIRYCCPSCGQID